jgi:anaerobic ribonucleoside-triphosphate reductase activating protein
MKYTETDIVLREIPTEITLAINISGCPHKCAGCHSKYLRQDIGTELNEFTLQTLIQNNKGITCVCFMGGDGNTKYLNQLAKFIKSKDLKVGYYSGNTQLSDDIELCNFDYIKIGPYIEDKGPLNSKTTNQRFYEVVKENKKGTSMYVLVDKTSIFWQ